MKLIVMSILVLSSATVVHAQQEKQFADSSETTPELIELWEQANGVCRGSSGDDVKTVAACATRAVYGAALNEREWCFGREEEASAAMHWHQCEVHSLRFPRIDTWLF